MGRDRSVGEGGHAPRSRAPPLTQHVGVPTFRDEETSAQRGRCCSTIAPTPAPSSWHLPGGTRPQLPARSLKRRETRMAIVGSSVESWSAQQGARDYVGGER